MNHLDQDESPDWKDDIDAFEDQLRSLRPTPPARSWNSMSESIETTLGRTSADHSISPATSVWRPIISHSITAAIGLAVGVAVMLLQPLGDPGLVDATGNSNSSSLPIQVVDDQASDRSQRTASDLQTQDSVLVAGQNVSNGHRQAKLLRRSHRLSQTNWNSTALRAFGSTDERLVSGREWLMEPSRDQRFAQPEDSDAGSTRLDQTDHESIDEPVLSPRSFPRSLDDLTYLPTLGNPFCEAEGFSS